MNILKKTALAVVLTLTMALGMSTATVKAEAIVITYEQDVDIIPTTYISMQDKSNNGHTSIWYVAEAKNGTIKIIHSLNISNATSTIGYDMHVNDSTPTQVATLGTNITYTPNTDMIVTITITGLNIETYNLQYQMSVTSVDFVRSYVGDFNADMNDITVEAPTIISKVFLALSSAVAGFIVLLKVIFADTGVIGIFYSSDSGLTFGGALLVVALAYSITLWAFRKVKNLVAMRL